MFYTLYVFEANYIHVDVYYYRNVCLEEADISIQEGLLIDRYALPAKFLFVGKGTSFNKYNFATQYIVIL